MFDPITVLLPCKDQKIEFFEEAVRSIVQQSCPDWKLLVLFDAATPDSLWTLVNSFRDERIAVMTAPNRGFASALNFGLSKAETEFVSLLLSDDLYSESAIETIQRRRLDNPDSDFFYSSRRYVNNRGEFTGPVMTSVGPVTMDHFRTIGCQVKHLLCWRRRLALEIGGLDEELSDHACDDYDFPWRMAEAGCRFEAIPDCLYFYRKHIDFSRLTTGVPVNNQVEILHRMFRKHGVPEEQTCRFLQSAVDGYLIRSHDEMPDDQEIRKICYSDAGPEMEEEFRSKGFKKRHIFPHRVYRLPKGGPDGFRLTEAMTGIADPARMRELVLYGLPPATREFPESLFMDDDLVWHQQQFGVPYQVASANAVLDGERLFGVVYVSDIVQRISRRRDFKTRIEVVFKGWTFMLLNALLDYAVDLGVKVLYSPRAEYAMKHTDRQRRIQPSLYERIYDATPMRMFEPEAAGDWWRIDVEAHRDRRVPLIKKVERIAPEKTICIIHDVEQGFGHMTEDPTFAAAIHEPAARALDEILEIEEAAGVYATYNIVGILWSEVYPKAAPRGHACAFHSFDHAPEQDDAWQLLQCRRLDYRAKGYRPPKSRIAPGLSNQLLSFHNFEWLASGFRSLGTPFPSMESGIVKIPVHLDDFALRRGDLNFAGWEELALSLIDKYDLVVIGLHECYFEHWVPHYRSFLEKIAAKARFKTLDEVAAEVTLAHARWV